MINIDNITIALLNSEHASIIELLTLRVLLDECDPVQNIELDLHDLYLFPERLEQSYCDEWRLYVRNFAHKVTTTLQSTQTTDVSRYLKSRLAKRKDWCEHVLSIGIEAITHAKAIGWSKNVVTLSNHFKKSIEKMGN